MEQVVGLVEKPFEYWLKKNWYYYQLLKHFYCFALPKKVRVLQIGCKNGYLLDAVDPSYGVGIDDDTNLIHRAQAYYKQLTFYAAIEQIPLGTTFDYLILSSITMEVDDIQLFLKTIQRVCHPGTRIVIDTYSYLWEPLLLIAQKIGLRRPTKLEHWLSQKDLVNFLPLADFEVITTGGHIMLPIYIPGLSWFFNNIIGPLPFLNMLCLNKWIIARPKPVERQASEMTVSIVVPCKNEKGNIEAVVQRCPVIGKHTEFIFVEGHSKDGTYDEIVRVAQQYQNKTITYFKQQGKGKGAAVRQGFEQANGDVLMILDADLTAPPEELPKFFEALVSGKGEFINGSRLIYGMESGSMRFLNLLANYCFGLGFSWLLGQPIKDTLCGTKVLFKTDYEKIVGNRAYFGDFDPFGDFDLLFGAAKQNLKIIDMPVHYKNRTYGTTQIHRFQAGVLLLRMSFIAWKKFKFRS